MTKDRGVIKNRNADVTESIVAYEDDEVTFTIFGDEEGIGGGTEGVYSLAA